ncbi:hypothetical protein ACV772_004153 [Proteus mirabilis]|uniref:Uncharacterized protein n=1 Tax=Escherichia coli TaxID=562 RepID=A0A7U1E3G5_ECOLX|nr:hypothetical protein [Escherichia coli]CSI73091.1 Uncharacterised protein [Vibrio cholerae]SJK87219.1 hypothetical protein RCEC007_1160003 [Escherichia coli]
MPGNTRQRSDREGFARVGGSGNDQYPDPGWPSWPPHEACSASLQYCVYIQSIA